MNKRRKYDGNTLVHLAVKMDKEEMVGYWLDKGHRWKVDLKAKNKEGLAPIHMAIRQKSMKIVNVLARHQS